MFEVLSTSGDTHLGGDDFDKRIVDFLADEFKKNEGIDLRKDRQVLSSSCYVSISMPALTDVHAAIAIGRLCSHSQSAVAVLIAYSSSQQ